MAVEIASGADSSETARRGNRNLVDRVAIGGVIDFLNIGVGPLRTGIFNVADVAIMAGIALLIADRWRQDRAVASTQ